jgi:hypothetical protein
VKITIENTSQIVMVGTEQNREMLPARVWEGETATGRKRPRLGSMGKRGLRDLKKKAGQCAKLPRKVCDSIQRNQDYSTPIPFRNQAETETLPAMTGTRRPTANGPH